MQRITKCYILARENEEKEQEEEEEEVAEERGEREKEGEEDIGGDISEVKTAISRR